LRRAIPTQLHLSITIVDLPRTLLENPAYQRLRSDAARRAFILDADDTAVLWDGSVLQAFDSPTTLQTEEDDFTVTASTTCTHATDDDAIRIAFAIHLLQHGKATDFDTMLVHRGPSTNAFILGTLGTLSAHDADRVRQVLVESSPR
ncbi:MAG: hypothetical protein KC983_12650, partial [Phycisphaerales bacterium]|nr:hypothetical protein [Phycisphaerales bacterium]